MSFALSTVAPAALLVGTARPLAAAEPLDPTRFEVTVLSTGLKQPMEMAVAGAEEQGPTLLMPGRPDSYNSSRLLSETFLARLRDFVGGDLAVGLPGRDFFVAVVANAPDMVDHVRRRVREDFRQTDHPLTDRMLLITADGVSELIDD